MTHSITCFEGGKFHRDFKVGVAVPCFFGDVCYLGQCFESIHGLFPQPSFVAVDVNLNSSKTESRRKLFDFLFFEKGCDVVLVCDVDFYLLPKILWFVKKDRVVSFPALTLRRWDLPLVFIWLLFGGWGGCYSMPLKVWKVYGSRFEDLDSGIWHVLGKWNFDFHKGFCYYALRPYAKESVCKLLSQFPLWKRVLWSLTRLGLM